MLLSCELSSEVVKVICQVKCRQVIFTCYGLSNVYRVSDDAGSQMCVVLSGESLSSEKLTNKVLSNGVLSSASDLLSIENVASNIE